MNIHTVKGDFSGSPFISFYKTVISNENDNFKYR